MAIETATYISDLVSTNPATADFIYEGDDHIRLVKAVVKATFPNVTGAVTLTHTALNSALLTTTAGQWVLMKSTTVSGTPSVVDFINGTDGVVISALYDQYLLDFTNIKSTSGTATMRIQISENAGSSYPANATGCAWSSDHIAGVSTISSGSASAFLTLTNVTVPAADPGWSGQVLIARPLSAVLTCPVYAQLVGVTADWVTTAGTVASTTSQFDALRFTLSASTFAGSNARVRFYARRA